MDNNKINILIFDIDEVTTTLIENYLKEFDFLYEIKKFPKFDKSFITVNNDTFANFIFVDVSKDNDYILDDINSISKDKKNIFFFMCENPTTDLYVKSLRAGAKEFLKKPIERNFFISTIKNNFQFNSKETTNEQNKTAKIITVVSNETACGKTTFAINISREITEKYKSKVLLIDFNENLCNSYFLLDIDNRSDINYFLDYTTEKNAKTIFNKLYKYKDTSMYVMSVSIYKRMNYNIEPDRIKNFIEIASKYFDYIIIDVNNVMQETNQKIFSISDLVFYIISTSINSNIQNKTFIENNLKNIKYKLVLNKYKNKDDMKIKEIENILGISLRYKIPLNFGISSHFCEFGKTIRDIKPESEILKVYDTIADYVVTKA